MCMYILEVFILSWQVVKNITVMPLVLQLMFWYYVCYLFAIYIYNSSEPFEVCLHQ